MSRRLARVAVFAALTIVPAWAAEPETSGPTPPELVAGLQSLQAQIALGDAAAYAAQPKALHDIAIAFTAAKPDVWRETRNVSAAVTFLLSGGQPRALVQVLESGKATTDDEKLIRGALAYVLGDTSDAEKLLGPLDPRSLDFALGGQVAFAQSMLMTAKDKRKAIQLLDLARLLSPGGLVEEAALRREILLAGDMRDIDRFTMLSRQYMTRFPRSVYASNFMRGFAANVVRLGLAEDLANFEKFDGLSASLTLENRLGLFLTVARGALLNGKVVVAQAASARALLLARPDSVDQAQARLYQAAAQTLTDHYDLGVAELLEIDPKKLPAHDQALLGVAKEMTSHLRDVPQIANPPATTPAREASDDEGNNSAAATIRVAQTALTQADAFLSERMR
jgi:chemotaxis protein MotC